MDSILADIQSFMTATGPRCQTCVWLEAQPAEQQKAWDTHIADPRLQTSAITKAMQKHGFGYKEHSVAEHRKAKHRVR